MKTSEKNSKYDETSGQKKERFWIRKL